MYTCIHHWMHPGISFCSILIFVLRSINQERFIAIQDYFTLVQTESTLSQNEHTSKTQAMSDKSISFPLEASMAPYQIFKRLR